MGWENDEKRNYGYTTLEPSLHPVLNLMIEVCGPDESFDIRELLFLSKTISPEKFGTIRHIFNPTIRRMIEKVSGDSRFNQEDLDTMTRRFRK